MDIRKVTQQHTPEVRAMWEICFPEDSARYVSFYFDTIYSPENTIGLFENEQLVASLQLLPRTIRIRNKPIDTYFIVGACTLPQARKKGYMRELLQYAFALSSSQTPVSVLYPFRYSFYRAMDYAVISERLLLSIESKQIPRPEKQANRLITDVDIPVLLSIEHDCFARFDGRIEHTSQDIQNSLGEYRSDNVIGLIDEKQQWFLWYYLRGDTCHVARIAYRSLSALYEALGSLANKAKQLHCPLSLRDNLHEWLADSRNVLALEPFFMLRMIDIPLFLQEMPCLCDTDVVIRVLDSFYEPNHGNWRIQTNNKIISSVTKTTQPADVTLSILDFTRWACGICDANDLTFESIDQAQHLQFLPLQSNYFCDMY